MKTTVSLSDFRNAFIRCDRQNQFSYDALKVLFEYFEALEEAIGEEIELDVIAICCDYAESDVAEIAGQYSIDLSDLDEEEEKRECVIEYLRDNTTVAGETNAGSIVYAQF